MPRPPRSELTQTGAYRPEVIELALLTYAVEGNVGRAAQVVKDRFGAGPTKETIRKWANEDYNDLYLQIREGEAEKIKARVATHVEDLLRESLEVTGRALRRTDAKLDELDARDMPGALRNVATNTAILADKLQQMRGGQQITISHELNADELLSKISRLLPGSAAIEGSAEEVSDAELAQPLGRDESSEAVSGA